MAPQLPLQNDHSILIVRLGALGDIIHTLPAVYAIRKKYPEIRIDWIAEARSSEILKNCTFIDSIIEIDTKKWRKNIYNPSLTLSTVKEISNIIGIMKKRKYHIAIDFQGLIKSGLIAFLSGAKTSAGFDREHLREPLSRIFITNHFSPEKKDVHIIEKNFSLLKSIGIESKVLPFKNGLRLLGAEDIKEQTLKKYKLNEIQGQTVGIYPGGGWQTKLWESGKYASLIQKIQRIKGINVVLIAGKGEDKIISEIIEKLDSKPLCITGTSIKELSAILSFVDIIIGPDTGPLHLAAILGTSAVGIFGPSSPLRNGPYWGKHKIVHKAFPCSNCYKRDCSDLRCLKELTVQSVYDAFNELLEEI